MDCHAMKKNMNLKCILLNDKSHFFHLFGRGHIVYDLFTWHLGKKSRDGKQCSGGIWGEGGLKDKARGIF